MGAVNAQFIVPAWRGAANTEHAEWDEFTVAYDAATPPATNAPDVAADTPSSDASIFCTTPSAFLTSSKNIYSFSSATSFQLDDSAQYDIETVLLQVATLGNSLDADSVFIVAIDENGDPYLANPTSAFAVDVSALPTGPQTGGFDTVWAFQWDFSAHPIPTGQGPISILFNSVSPHMSLDKVSLDTSASFEVVRPPMRLNFELDDAKNCLVFTWSASLEGFAVLEATTELSNSSSWQIVTENPTEENNHFTLEVPIVEDRKFYRLRYL